MLISEFADTVGVDDVFGLGVVDDAAVEAAVLPEVVPIAAPLSVAVAVGVTVTVTVAVAVTVCVTVACGLAVVVGMRGTHSVMKMGRAVSTD